MQAAPHGNEVNRLDEVPRPEVGPGGIFVEAWVPQTSGTNPHSRNTGMRFGEPVPLRHKLRA